MDHNIFNCESKLNTHRVLINSFEVFIVISQALKSTLFGFFTIRKSDRSDRNKMQFLRVKTA